MCYAMREQGRNQVNLNTNTNARGATTVETDAGLRSFMLGVYNRMALALLLTALLATLSTQQPLAELIHGVGADGKPTMTIIGMICAFGPLLLILGLGLTGLTRTVTGSAVALFGVAALFGLSLGSLAFIYTATSLGMTFMITASMFFALSLFGYTTKINLNAVGSACIMLLFGLIIAMVINIFLKSSVMDFVISLAGVVIFSVLTAWDTQRLKSDYAGAGGDKTSLTVAANNGALNLYLDFVNLFLFLLRFLGVKKD